MTDVDMDPSQAVRSRNSSESMEDLQLVCIMCKKQGDLSTFFGRYCSDDCVNVGKLLKKHSLNASLQKPDFRKEQSPKTIHSNKSEDGQSENFKIDSKSMNSKAAIKIEKSPAQKELRKCSNCGAWTTNPTYCTRQCFIISRKKMRKKRMQGHQSDFLKSKQTLSRHKGRVNLHSKCISCGKDAKGKLVCSTVCRARNASAYVKNKNHNSNTSVFVDNQTVQNSMKHVHGISDQKAPSTISRSPTKMSSSGMSYDERPSSNNGSSPSHITPLDGSRRKYIVESSSCTWPSDSSIHVANIRSINKQDEYNTQHARNCEDEKKGACDSSSKECSSAMFTRETIEQQANQLPESHNFYRQDVTRHCKESNFMNQHSVDTENYHGERDPVIPRQNSPNLSTNRVNRHNNSTNSRPKNTHNDYANSTLNGRNVSSNSRSNSYNDSSNLRLHSQDVSSRLDSHNDSSNSRLNYRDFFSLARQYSLGLGPTPNSGLISKDNYFNSKQRSHDIKLQSLNSRQNSQDDPTNERLYAHKSSSNSRRNSHNDISSSRLHGHNEFSMQNSCDDFSNSRWNFNDDFSNSRGNSRDEFLNSRQNFNPEPSNPRLHSLNVNVNSQKNSHNAPPNSRPHTEDDSSNSRINFNNSSTARRLSQNESFPPGNSEADDSLKINRLISENNLAFMNRMLLSEDSEIYRLHCDEIKSQIALNKTKEEYFRCEIKKSRLEHKLMFEKSHPSHN